VLVKTRFGHGCAKEGCTRFAFAGDFFSLQMRSTASCVVQGDLVFTNSPAFIPDFDYIRKEVSIIAVARELDIDVVGLRARCWRPENHRGGDANPSVGFYKKANKARCFVCDPHTLSNLDLVMSVLGFNLKEAGNWIRARFPVRPLPKGQHTKKRIAWSPRYRIGIVSDVIDVLVRSGLWATLTASERSILVVLTIFTENDTGFAEI